MKVQERFKNMNIFERFVEFSKHQSGKQILISLFSLVLLFATWPHSLSAQQDTQAPPQAAPESPYTQQTPDQLQQLVAPIALYPDSLVAQILAASTFPEQVVEANRWVQAHPDLKGDALGQAVDQQPWDPSVKALTAFPSILGNMDKNLSWTSSLGDAYYNQQQIVMDAVQVMRQRAQEAGNLNTTPQQTVTTEGSTIVVEPANPEVVYVPAYDPWLVYGGPVMAWPGWYPYPGIWFGGPDLSFGIGFGIGFYGGFGWGWPHWGFDWQNRYSTFHNTRYLSRSTTFYNRRSYYRGGGAGGGVSNRFVGTARAFNGNKQAARGYAAPRGQIGVRSGAFRNIEKGGQTRRYSSRGRASLGGRAAHVRSGGGPRGRGGGGVRYGGGGGRR